MHATIHAVQKACATFRKGPRAAAETIAEAFEMDEVDVKKLMEPSADATSLETPMGSDEGTGTIGAMVPDDSDQAPEEIVAERLLSEDIDVVLGQLGDRERRVIELRYGISGDEPLTLVEIGKFIGVTREGVCQTEIAAIEKLRRGGATERLRWQYG